jgi:hypothetical protein
LIVDTIYDERLFHHFVLRHTVGDVLAEHISLTESAMCFYVIIQPNAGVQRPGPFHLLNEIILFFKKNARHRLYSFSFNSCPFFLTNNLLVFVGDVFFLEYLHYSILFNLMMLSYEPALLATIVALTPIFSSNLNCTG